MVSNLKRLQGRFARNTWFFEMDGNSRRPKATKRKKPVKECPNPLFLKWLERWRDEAKAKESKLQYVYNKVRIKS